MVRRALEVVYKEILGLHQAAYVLALFTVGSQVLALVRDRLLAHEFGAGIELDLYYAAFRIPDLLYVLFASTLSVYVLIPFVSERVTAGGAKRAQAFLSQIYSTFLILYTLLALILAVFAPQVVALMFPGFSEHTAELTLLMRILLLQPLFLGISSLFGVITQLGHRFVLYALSPLLYNAGIILGILVLYPLFGLPGIAFGVVLGAVGHVAIQVPFIVKSELTPHLVFRVEWSNIKSVLMTSAPRALTLSLHQIVLLGLVGFASVMAEGSVSVFQFGLNLQSVPLAIIGVSYSVASFPVLVQLYSGEKFEAFGKYLLTALRHIIFWSLPFLALIVVVRAQFVRVVLGTGAFDWDDTRLTAAVLALFAVSLLAQGINLLVVRALYAVGKTRLPFILTLISSIGIFLFALVFYELFVSVPSFRHGLESVMRVTDVPGTEVLVLALAYSSALLIHAFVMVAISARFLHFSGRALLGDLARGLFAAIVAGATAYAILNLFVEGVRTEKLLGVFLQGLIATSTGLFGAILAYYVVGSRELREVYKALHRRVFKTSDITPPQDEDHLAV